VGGDLFRKYFGHEPPTYPRHFVLVYGHPPVSRTFQLGALG